MLDRLIANIRAIIRSEFPNYAFMGVYEYVIQGTGDTINADPVDTTIGLPSIADMPMAAGLLGEIVEPTIGKICYVIFLNGDRTKPRVIGAEGSPLTVALEATTSIELTAPDVTISASSATISAGTTSIGTAATGVATVGTTAPLIALLVAERTTLVTFFNTPTVAAISSGTAAPAAAACAAVLAALPLPTNFSQTVSAAP